ncbi:MAG: signal peptidase I [Pisciglobus halotolerans]|nr:signal peptidase I [Pisciglobus halotolerans]
MAAAIVVFILIRTFLFSPVSVDGDSMVPTLHDHDRLILNKVSSVDRFDVIVFDAPDDPGKQYIKRVIGLPGDTIEVQDDQLHINGKEYSENYLDSSLYQLEAWENYTEDFSLSSLGDKQQVPADSYFVMGDNRLNSKDSRSFGFVKKEQVIGTAEFRIWPFDALGNIDKQEKEE